MVWVNRVKVSDGESIRRVWIDGRGKFRRKQVEKGIASEENRWSNGQGQESTDRRQNNFLYICEDTVKI